MHTLLCKHNGDMVYIQTGMRATGDWFDRDSGRMPYGAPRDAGRRSATEARATHEGGLAVESELAGPQHAACQSPPVAGGVGHGGDSVRHRLRRR